GTIRIQDPLTLPSFVGKFVPLGNIHNDQAGVPRAPQAGSATLLEAGDDGITSAVWQDNQLYAVSTVNPVAGPDAGQATVHWHRIDTSNAFVTLTLAYQGDVGGEEIGPGTSTFFPSLAVDTQGNMAIGFSASGPNTDPGAHYTGRLATDPAGTVAASGMLAA